MNTVYSLIIYLLLTNSLVVVGVVVDEARAMVGRAVLGVALGLSLGPTRRNIAFIYSDIHKLKIWKWKFKSYYWIHSAIDFLPGLTYLIDLSNLTYWLGREGGYI